MKIMTIDAPSLGGGKALALCTDDGEPLGFQIACKVSCEVGDMPTATITFLVDGEKLSFGEMQ